MDVKEKIFKKGSKTYYNSSKFFPKLIRDEVTTLYAFVRIVDDYVDSIPQQEEKFYQIKKQLYTRLKGKASGNDLVDDFVSLAEERDFDKRWIDAFMDSMEFDLTGKKCTTQEQTKKYVYGSAEVIGLFMAKIMDIPEKSYKYARAMGSSMQMINFIRDINEDLEMKRWYLPLDITKTKLEDVTREYLLSHKEDFCTFMREHIKAYRQEAKEAEKGYTYLPYSVRVPIATASKIYKWTADQIEKDPMIVFEKKVKPSKSRILITLINQYVLQVLQ